ncbi:MAG: tryptophan-rich sensory protein [Ruminococcus sp.]|nr:tryptophan-rich sensory protein [Ruminococcus sp.]
MKKPKLTDLLIFIVSAELAGAFSALISGGQFSEYYNTLVKPPIAPPGWVFPVTWVILYALMGTAAYIVSLSDSMLRPLALKLYGAQLAVNVIWSPIFFGSRSFAGAAVTAVLLLILVTAMELVFFRISENAAFIALPYLIWTAYAAYLSFGFLVLN